jgi:hypothetical protein
MRRTRRRPWLLGAALLVGIAAPAVASAGEDVSKFLDDAHMAQAQGRLDEAARLVVRARVAAPTDLAPVRAACEIGLSREETGQFGGSSREACHRAMVMRTQPEDFRNEVASLMSPAVTPSLDDLAIAALSADAALREGPDQPWGIVARCDIARRLGSADVMEACVNDLKRVAPTHPATLEVFARIDRQRSGLSTALGLFVLSIFLGTLVHALANAVLARPRRRVGGPKTVIPLTLALCFVSGAFVPPVARAAETAPEQGKPLSRLKIDDANPEASVPSAEQQASEPLQFGYFIQDLVERAEHAAKAGDHGAAARYYRALTRATTTSVAPRQLCRELEASGDMLNAVVACRTAITRSGTTSRDFARFVKLVLAQKGPLPVNEKAELETQIDHLSAELQKQGSLEGDAADASAAGGAILVPSLRCEVALRFRDTSGLEACAGVLAKVAPDDPQTVSFQWALAVDKHDRGEAARLVQRARILGMSQEGVARMERATTDMQRRWLSGVVMAIALSGFLATLAAYAVRRSSSRRGAPA